METRSRPVSLSFLLAKRLPVVEIRPLRGILSSPFPFNRSQTLRITCSLTIALAFFLCNAHAEGESSTPPAVRNQSPAPSILPVFGGAPPLNPEEPHEPLKQKRLYQVAEGPWGDLEYYVVHLQAPLSWMEFIPIPSERTIWNFASSDPAEIIKLVNATGIGEFKGRHWSVMGEFHAVPGEPGLGFIPDDDLILRISPIQRTALAKVLRANDLNRTYQEPVVIESGDALSWYQEAGLDSALAQKIASLCYRRGHTLVLSDAPYIVSTLATIEEQRAFIRATTRTRSLVLRLNIGNGDAYKEVADYWTSGHKQKAVMPILESIAETPGVERLDIAHLLPPTPRKLLYTYPDLRSFLTIGERDCHWTSFNFFKSEPDAVLSERVMAEWLHLNYEPVKGDLHYGDLLMLRNAETGEPIHSATFIAGDIVFTKNGRERLSPWILMRYTDMERRYKQDHDISASVFRLKEGQSL
ncbi:MAG: hypothetical protein P1U68_03510 [Verrucomicrobiales bacterium]|nr:hypothetical protein [Verrucomicrobiales bacterium]